MTSFCFKYSSIFVFCIVLLNLNAQESLRNNDSLIISGIDSSAIIYKNKKRTSCLSCKIPALPFNRYTCLLAINKNTVIAGTSNNFVFVLRRHKFSKIDRSFGLEDSCITSIYFDKKTKKIYIQSNKSEYIVDIQRNRIAIKKIINPNIIQVSQALTRFKRFFRLPIQRFICESLSGIDLSGRQKKYISSNEIKKIKRLLKPGDILLKHNNNQLINIGIPGKWSHSALYVGGENEINEYFKNLSYLGNIKAFDYIKKIIPEVTFKLIKRNFLIIESVSEGVVINHLNNIAAVDRFVAFRTTLSKEDVFRCLLDALEQYGKPYDYLFDMNLDDYLFCSELIYKSYSYSKFHNGIPFMLSTLNGAKFLSPNDIAKQYCKKENNIENSLHFVVCFEGIKNHKPAQYIDSTRFCEMMLH